MTKVYPNPFTTNPKNAEFVENNQIGLLLIDTENHNTLLGHEEQKIEDKANRAAEAFRRRQERLNQN